MRSRIGSDDGFIEQASQRTALSVIPEVGGRSGFSRGRTGANDGV